MAFVLGISITINVIFIVFSIILYKNKIKIKNANDLIKEMGFDLSAFNDFFGKK